MVVAPEGSKTGQKKKKKISVYITEEFEEVINMIKRKRPYLSRNDLIQNALLIYYELLYARENGMDPCEAIMTGGF